MNQNDLDLFFNLVRNQNLQQNWWNNNRYFRIVKYVRQQKTFIATKHHKGYCNKKS
jgi:hypothetical protein